jgi:hypothetical protein
MHRVPRVIALVLLLAVTVSSTAAFASPPPAAGTLGALSAVWEPLARIWGWLSGQPAPQGPVMAPPAGRHAVPKAAAQPVNTPPAAQTDDGMGADPNGG